MKYYHNNATDTPVNDIGLLPYPPYYWWESGAMWGGMIDFYSYTKDSSYVAATIQGLLAQTGPDNNYIIPAQMFDEVRRFSRSQSGQSQLTLITGQR
jgi:mannan endo-1,6-alpha-mannosidase